ncbi:twin-arginine translocase TatA/TatE family subunit [Pseudoclavibacter caeni]|uniref:twin-arginine translocase TatA/TatE family subunit n=1 Tax=Pseudoclavibacter caeni TaxID=908846 RepID=UPI001CE46E18|nr:twin-arginine translocase TatA/TatE family subunit [Pseudoclavibacter caeni]
MGLSFEKILLVAVVAAILLGPSNLPRYAETLGRATRRFKLFVQESKQRVKEESSDVIDDVDWRKLDPRQYDPRRIIADALRDDPTPTVAAAAAAAAAQPSRVEIVARQREDRERNLRPAPFDDDAT